MLVAERFARLLEQRGWRSFSTRSPPTAASWPATISPGSSALGAIASRVFGFGSPRAWDEPYAELPSDDRPARMVDFEAPLSRA